MLKLLVKETDDEVVRENFKRLQKELTGTQVILKGQWKFFDLTFDGVVTNFKVKHEFNFVPLDIIHVSTLGVGFGQFNYNSFDRTNLDISTSDACRLRFFAGRYEEGAEEL